MYYECCVCKSSRQDAILHHFPCTEKRLTMWLECLNRDDLKKLSQEQLSKLFVCQKHFEKKFLTPKSRLLGKGYPTLFTEDEISSGIPAQAQENSENVDPQTEHNYSRKIHFDHTYSRLEPLKENNASGTSESQNLPEPSQNLSIIIDNVEKSNSEQSIEMIVGQARRERLNVHSRAYTAGWVVRKICSKLNINCNLSKRSLTNTEQSRIHDWISHREYTAARNRVIYPSEGAVRCFGAVIAETNEFLEHSAHENFVCANIKYIILSKYLFI